MELHIMIKLNEIRGFIKNGEPFPEIPYKNIKEGNVTVQIADSDSIYDAPAFFNPVMVLNRDMSILFSTIFAKLYNYKLRVIEPLAGIGIRGMRLIAEIPEVIDEVVVNDFGDISTKIASFNNKSDKLIIFNREARSLLSELAERGFRFHYLDLDPFGPPTPFLDNIWNALKLRSMVAVTATDMTALCGVFPKACMRKYSSIPLNNHHTHETAARILIATVIQSAARMDHGARPVFTASVDHYVKVFFEVNKRSGAITDVISQIGFSYTCDVCHTVYYSAGRISHDKHCCGKKIDNIAGPLWVGDLFDPKWCSMGLEIIDELNLNSSRRISKILTEGTLASGLHGYYSMEQFGRKLKITLPKFAKLKQSLEEIGYRVVPTTFTKQSFRSDASGSIIMEKLRELSGK